MHFDIQYSKYTSMQAFLKLNLLHYLCYSILCLINIIFINALSDNVSFCEVLKQADYQLDCHQVEYTINRYIIIRIS